MSEDPIILCFIFRINIKVELFCSFRVRVICGVEFSILVTEKNSPSRISWKAHNGNQENKEQIFKNSNFNKPGRHLKPQTIIREKALLDTAKVKTRAGVSRSRGRLCSCRSETKLAQKLSKWDPLGGRTIICLKQ